MDRNYDSKDAKSIFLFSRGLLHKSLYEAVSQFNPNVDLDEILSYKGKGNLGQLVEKFYFGYEPNSSPYPDFKEAGLELKTTPLKTNDKDELFIKERLVCDMIDYCSIVNVPFEESLFYRKSLLMLIMFYLHVAGKKPCDLEFLYSVLWRLKGKDLLIIKQDYEVIVNKIRAGKAHELSEGDTLYLGACRKGQKNDSLRKQPYSEVNAPKRAFSLKPAYMRTILEFVKSSGKDMVTNTDISLSEKYLELVTERDLKSSSLESILTKRIMKFKGKDYKQIAAYFNINVIPQDKSKYARVTRRILLKGLNHFEEAEEIAKAGIIVKTIRLEKDGNINESMSFENIDYEEIYETDDWIDSRWYEIVTSRFMFVVYRAVDSDSVVWENERRYILDKVVFWTMPSNDLEIAEKFWLNIKNNVTNDTLQDSNNTFWKLSDGKYFHVRPKAQKSSDKYYSPLSGVEVPKKAYWFNSAYVGKIII